MVDPLVGNEYAALLCSGLSNAGVEITLIVPENREITIAVDYNVKKWSPPKGGSKGKIIKTFKYIFYLFRLFVFILSYKPTVVHYQFFRRKSELLFFLLLGALGIRLVYTAHNVFPHERNKIDFFINNLVYKTSGKIIVHSDFIKRKIADNFSINEDKISVILHGNFDFYIPQHFITICEAREKLGLKETDNVLLFFGNIREYKGLDLLLSAFNKAAKGNSELKLLIAGNPSSETLRIKYQEIIKNSEFSDRIISRFDYVPADEVALYLISSDIVVLPYKSIDHSGIIHLAYSFGKPVIATNVGDFEESIDQGKSGYLIEENTSECLALNIGTVFSSKENLLKMGQYAKNLNDTKYSWVSIAEKTMELYE